MGSLADYAKKLNKEFKDDNLMIMSDIKPDYDRLPTNALGLDYILGGGLVLGRLYEFSGLFHSGKTGAACAVLAAYQRAFPDKICVFVDAEHTLDLKFWAKMTGLDLSKLYYLNPNGQSGQQVLDIIEEIQQTDDVGAIVLDSLPALIPSAVLESDLTKDAGMRATMAKPLYPFCAKMAEMVAQKNNIFIMINQVRDGGKTFTGVQLYKEPCGMAPMFYSSIIVRFGTRKFTLEDNMDYYKQGKDPGEGADGFRLMFKIVKNKCGSCARGGGFLTFRYATGLDWVNDLLEIATTFKFIQQNGAYITLTDLETGEAYKDEDGNVLKGYKKDMINYIKTNIPFQTKYLAMLNRYISRDDSISYGELLDERTKLEINAQQAEIDSQFANQAKEE